jgi:hypothetical protein
MHQSMMEEAEQDQVGHRSALGIEEPVHHVHAIDQRADVQPPPSIILFGVFEEAVGVGDMPGIAAEVAQGRDRMLTRQLQHLLFIKAISLLTQLVSQVAEQGGGLVADPT